MSLKTTFENVIVTTLLLISFIVLFTETGFSTALNFVSYCLRLIGLT